MKSPFTGKEMRAQKEWRTMDFRKDKFEVLFHFYKCEDTGEQFEDEAFAQLNYNQVVNQYREKYNIPFPEQIKAIREKYNLSAAKMSEILGFGANGYRQYEVGEVPNQSNGKLIQLAEDPHEFRKLVSLCATLEAKISDKLNKTIDHLIEQQKEQRFARQLAHYFFGECRPSQFTGYKTPSLEKFMEMVVFFTEKLQPWKTKLNKLLFYADFSAYQQTGFSISGVQYRAIPLGPVPKNYDTLFEYLANNEAIAIHYTNFADGGTGEQFKPNPAKKCRTEVFTEAELQVLHAVAERFKNTTTNEIIEISHQEKGWIENSEERKVIDYGFGFEMVAVLRQLHSVLTPTNEHIK